MKFLVQAFQQLERKQDRQTHKQTDKTEHITTATFVPGNNCHMPVFSDGNRCRARVSTDTSGDFWLSDSPAKCPKNYVNEIAL